MLTARPTSISNKQQQAVYAENLFPCHGSIHPALRVVLFEYAALVIRVGTTPAHWVVAARAGAPSNSWKQPDCPLRRSPFTQDSAQHPCCASISQELWGRRHSCTGEASGLLHSTSVSQYQAGREPVIKMSPSLLALCLLLHSAETAIGTLGPFLCPRRQQVGPPHRNLYPRTDR